MLTYMIILTNRKITIRTLDNYLLQVQLIDQQKYESILNSVFYFYEFLFGFRASLVANLSVIIHISMFFMAAGVALLV